MCHDFKTFTYNKGLECLAAPRQGSPLAGELIAITEHSLDAAGNLRSYLLGSDRVVRFSLKRTDDFDVSDCAVLPPGDLLLLERRYLPSRGIAMRIRRLPLGRFKEGALVDGRPMIEANLSYQIDNMEGIAVYRAAGGETIVTLYQTTIFPLSSAICCCSLRWWGKTVR